MLTAILRILPTPHLNICAYIDVYGFVLQLYARQVCIQHIRCCARRRGGAVARSVAAIMLVFIVWCARRDVWPEIYSRSIYHYGLVSLMNYWKMMRGDWGSRASPHIACVCACVLPAVAAAKKIPHEDAWVGLMCVCVCCNYAALARDTFELGRAIAECTTVCRSEKCICARGPCAGIYIFHHSISSISAARVLWCVYIVTHA